VKSIPNGTEEACIVHKIKISEKSGGKKAKQFAPRILCSGTFSNKNLAKKRAQSWKKAHAIALFSVARLF
jgi:hypothetical protein